MIEATAKQAVPTGRFVPADEAVRAIHSGHHVFVGSGCAEPELLVAALGRHASEVFDVEVLHLLTVGQAPYSHPSFEGRLRHNAFFIGPNVRQAVHTGHADYTPCFLSEIPSFIRGGRIPIDVALIQTTPPDEHGFVSLGINVDVIKAAVDAARVVIAQVNPNMPRTHGDSFLPVTGLDAMVWGDVPLLEYHAEPLDDVVKRIGRHVAQLVEDGSTLQTGIGAIPDAVLGCLTEKKDLGVHTEMFSDGLIPLIESGVVTNARKSIHRGKVVSSFCLGTRRLYEYVHNNPAFEFRPTDHVNDPWVIAQNDRMVSINSALQIDLTGQVCADSIGPRFYSGVGGQVDFIRGATRSKGGKSILAFPSTAKGGRISRIVPMLDQGAGVVTSRADVDFIVTEHGIAELKGRTIRERAVALIQIADPSFRPQLLEEAKRLSFVYPDQMPLPEGARPCPSEFNASIELPVLGTVQVRPMRTTDERALRDLFYSHSPETVYLRYGVPLKNLSRRQIQELVTLDYEEQMAIAAFVGEHPSERMIGVARYHLDRSTRMAEMALTVHDEYQGQGLGTLLFQHLARIAKTRGVEGFVAIVQRENHRMLRLFHKQAEHVESEVVGGTLRLSCRFHG